MNSLHATNATSVKECKTIGNLTYFLTNLYEKNGSEGTKAVLEAIKDSKHLLAGERGIYTILNKNGVGQPILLVELPWKISEQNIQMSWENFSIE